MNVLNRILAVILLLVLIALIVILAVAPAQGITAARGGLGRLEALRSGWDSDYYWPYLAGRAALLLIGVAILGYFLLREVSPRRRTAVKVHTGGGSQAVVTTDSIARRLIWHVDQLADVISVAPRVTARGPSVDVFLDVETGPDIDVPMKTDEVVSVVREELTQHMGLKPGRLEVRIRHSAFADAV